MFLKKSTTIVYPSKGNKAMSDCFEPIIFTRHHRQLRTLLLENQAWFCLQDTARLMGKALDERATWKLDADQRRTVWLEANGQCSKQLLISESGLFTMLVHHYVPENRALRRWITHNVLPTLHNKFEPHLPNLRAMNWAGSTVGLLEWQSKYWVQLNDMPELLMEPQTRRIGGLYRRFLMLLKGNWRELFGMGRGRYERGNWSG
nr:Bro-N domain-containing protein [Pseudomonas sp. LP_7_YM]